MSIFWLTWLGSGKTTTLASIALKYSKRKKPYNAIYTNIHTTIPGVTYIDNDCIGKYDLSNSLILIDEATLFADSRAYKEFPKDVMKFFLEHRHYNCDIYLMTQQWDGVDRKIRVITDRVYYVYKGKLFGWLWSSYYRIPYGIIIPDPRKGGEKLGEIIQGYARPNLLTRIFSTKVMRWKYYKYFDSWEREELPPLPDKYQPYIIDGPKAKKRLKTKKRQHLKERSKTEGEQELTPEELDLLNWKISG